MDHIVVALLDGERCDRCLVVVGAPTGPLAVELEVALMIRARHPELIGRDIVADQPLLARRHACMSTSAGLRSTALYPEDGELLVALDFRGDADGRRVRVSEVRCHDGLLG